MNAEQFAYQQEMQARLSGIGARDVISNAETRTLETTLQMAEPHARELLRNAGFNDEQIQSTSGASDAVTPVRIVLEKLKPLHGAGDAPDDSGDDA